ncbi:FCD domain-containing protein [Roseobacter sp. HKCCD9010]|nr:MULTISPECIES: GntR family transcriptional regulator [unclassified Roseobacter]MBF9052240.1 FCD domain-containing protein [Rhodobacterales bacterium HKCCD4356]NNW08767.1 FCD domain-containing protein [Roseobacter sp. HKCCD8431]NNW59929.1 FCD domain-containing protein [Roseobacter sp. HKCCD8629]NNY04488.1 FCD domain-containing protein [Roseobacter sp. HKCCD7635]NNY98498.1 FCD domain-containing protein [Roseobacter sp. HKCCD9052]NNZ79329.1 FCD domain-containing protein [Roseobacter sp. HKCCD8
MEHLTASQRVYAAIRDAISKGRCAVGERLIEESWAEEMNVSRTPVREALQRLSSDGFVIFTPHAGAFVRGWSSQEVREIYEIRANLEGLAAGLSAERADRAAIARLELSYQEWEEAVQTEPRNVLLISEKNHNFHTEILTISGNERLKVVCLQMMDLGFLARSFAQFDDASIRSSSEDHAALLKALRLGDGRLAEALMRSHILAAATKVIAYDTHDLT